jgi:1-acyl-sn-glycerol-3-phosphate acyltransferase
VDKSSVFVRGRLPPAGLKAMHALLQFLFWIFTDVEVRGRENVPPGGFILCANHLSRFDSPLGFVAVGPRPLTAFAGDTYRANLFFRTFVECVDVIWVHRGAIGPATMKAAIQALREGHMLGVAPEGTRSPTHALQRGKTGAAALAVAADVPILPMALTNTENLSAALMRLRRITLTVTFGKSFRLPPIEHGERAAKLDAYTDEIMCRIAALLPSRYHGVYAHHPRLSELRAALGN